jgi:hypothetical protein
VPLGPLAVFRLGLTGVDHPGSVPENARLGLVEQDRPVGAPLPQVILAALGRGRPMPAPAPVQLPGALGLAGVTDGAVVDVLLVGQDGTARSRCGGRPGGGAGAAGGE